MRNFTFGAGLILIRLIFASHAPNILGIWVAIEINLFGTTLFIVTNKVHTVDGIFKYYFAQCVGSGLIIFGYVVSQWVAEISVDIITICGIGIKIGAVPFH